MTTEMFYEVENAFNVSKALVMKKMQIGEKYSMLAKPRLLTFKVALRQRSLTFTQQTAFCSAQTNYHM